MKEKKEIKGKGDLKMKKPEDLEIKDLEEVKPVEKLIINKEGISTINQIIITAAEAGKLGFVDYERAFKALSIAVTTHAKPE